MRIQLLAIVSVVLLTLSAPNAFACTNNVPPQYLTDLGDEIRTPNGGIVIGFAGSTPYIHVVDVNENRIAGTFTHQLESTRVLWDELGRAYVENWVVWEPDSQMPDGQYEVDYDWYGVPARLIVEPQTEQPFVSIDGATPTWKAIQGGRTCCEVDPPEWLGGGCRDDCFDGVNFCEFCDWTETHHQPSLNIKLTSVPGPYVGEVVLTQGEHEHIGYFTGSLSNTTAVVIGDGENSADLCITARLFDSSEATVATSEPLCVPMSEFGERPESVSNPFACPKDSGANNQPDGPESSDTPTDADSSSDGGCSSLDAQPSDIGWLLLLGLFRKRRPASH